MTQFRAYIRHDDEFGSVQIEADSVRDAMDVLILQFPDSWISVGRVMEDADTDGS